MIHIDAYEFGRLIIDGKLFTRDVKIVGEQILPNWWRESGHVLQLKDIPELKLNVDAVVIGTGKYGRMQITPEVHQAIVEKNIPYIIEITDIAVTYYNRWVQEGKRVLGAFHLTC